MSVSIPGKYGGVLGKFQSHILPLVSTAFTFAMQAIGMLIFYISNLQVQIHHFFQQ